MPIEGTCEKCGSTTYDYGCLNCITSERDRMRQIILEHKDWMIAMAGLDNSPESPSTLRSGLLALVELAQKG